MTTTPKSMPRVQVCFNKGFMAVGNRATMLSRRRRCQYRTVHRRPVGQWTTSLRSRRWKMTASPWRSVAARRSRSQSVTHSSEEWRHPSILFRMSQSHSADLRHERRLQPPMWSEVRAASTPVGGTNSTGQKFRKADFSGWKSKKLQRVGRMDNTTRTFRLKHSWLKKSCGPNLNACLYVVVTL